MTASELASRFSEPGETPFELDHIGIAVETLEAGRVFYQALGFGEMHVEDVPSERVRVGFLKLGNRSNIELLEPTAPESPVRKFIDRRGAGIHHICLRVKNIDAVLSRLKGQGVRLIDEKAKIGAHQCRVAFIHPSAAGGVLIELSEKIASSPPSGQTSGGPSSAKTERK